MITEGGVFPHTLAADQQVQKLNCGCSFQKMQHRLAQDSSLVGCVEHMGEVGHILGSGVWVLKYAAEHVRQPSGPPP